MFRSPKDLAASLAARDAAGNPLVSCRVSDSGGYRVKPDLTDRLDRLDRLADNLDSRYRIPGTSIRFGWDGILGLIPGLGDIATLGPAGYILLEAHRLGAPSHVKGRMVFNSGVDWVVGSIPVIGDIFDVGWKANRRNVALLRRHFAKEKPGQPATRPDNRMRTT
ncbi:DUF4112 domain-containing protein [Jannaschia sp. S6380]|uniref:DUF4112 domain-containing protein n=1 Tax=Jannaschia sp. S6380 TaxID=2926408 RepID=UPI001FF3E90A|nr:DUF4112 domain-containing protein [Jannaschia sp. S6380]MCK0167407.1 DUF4112 domain-containing protein [Jannaschia sp. S6380]